MVYFILGILILLFTFYDPKEYSWYLNSVTMAVLIVFIVLACSAIFQIVPTTVRVFESVPFSPFVGYLVLQVFQNDDQTEK